MTQPKQPDSARTAREQADAYGSVFAPKELKLDDGTVIEVPPHPNLRLFDDDALAALEELNFKLESYDRHPEIYIPEQKVKDRAGNEIVLPAETRPGALKTNPHRKTDEDGNTTILNPPYEVQVVQIALGDDYETLRAGKVNGKRGAARHVWQLWNEQGAEVAARRDADPKSDDGADSVADVAAPDSQ